MRTLTLALSAAAMAALLSGCTYDRYAYRDGYARYAYVDRSETYYYVGGHRLSCRFDYDSRFCP